MNREILFSYLLYQYLFVSIFRAYAESHASEHASRVVTMKSAQRNLEIVAGFQAITKKNLTTSHYRLWSQCVLIDTQDYRIHFQQGGLFICRAIRYLQ